jgi:hypothetical protein
MNIQSVNQSISQSVNQSISQSIKHTHTQQQQQQQQHLQKKNSQLSLIHSPLPLFLIYIFISIHIQQTTQYNHFNMTSLLYASLFLSCSSIINLHTCFISPSSSGSEIKYRLGNSKTYNVGVSVQDKQLALIRQTKKFCNVKSFKSTLFFLIKH